MVGAEETVRLVFNMVLSNIGLHTSSAPSTLHRHRRRRNLCILHIIHMEHHALVAPDTSKQHAHLSRIPAIRIDIPRHLFLRRRRLKIRRRHGHPGIIDPKAALRLWWDAGGADPRGYVVCCGAVDGDGEVQESLLVARVGGELYGEVAGSAVGWVLGGVLDYPAEDSSG